MQLAGPKAMARRDAFVRQVTTHAGRWFDYVLARTGIPSNVPVANRDRGTVAWFGVEYELRSSRGDVPGGELPALSILVSQLPSRREIGRVTASAGALHLSFLSTKRVDQRALRHVTTAWFDGAAVASVSNADVPPSGAPSARALSA